MPFIQKAGRYFAFLAEHFPVMCASDEFHFMPRAEAAAEYYDGLENLDRDAVRKNLQEIHRFKDEFENTPVPENNLEAFIDKSLLLSNIDGILIKLEDKAILNHNPLIYLKVAFIGLDHAVSRPAENATTMRDRTLERLRRIPDLFEQAAKNLEGVSVSLRGPAENMIEDCILYLDEIERQLSCNAGAAYSKTLGILCVKVRSSLSRFRHFLEISSGEGAGASDRQVSDTRQAGDTRQVSDTRQASDTKRAADTIEATLKKHFLSTRSLEEVYRIGMEERERCLAELNSLRAAIDPDKTWNELYNTYTPVKNEDILSLYRSECSRLGEFFSSQGFDVPAEPLIVPTPLYLRSVRGSASFSASLPTDGPGSDYFYITSGDLKNRGTSYKERPHRETSSQEDMQQRVNRRLHREFKFLTAHETIPGHHLLDSCRRRLQNPIRRQIESPLFYEGWACYAESLLIEYGYIDSPIELLVNKKRGLWRAARCQIDAGLAAGLLDMNGCVDLLKEAGFEEDEARMQVGRFLLNPGYQLCYTLGRYEILQLGQQYIPALGLSNFHRELLGSGELPFTLLEKLLAEHLEGRNIK